LSRVLDISRFWVGIVPFAAAALLLASCGSSTSQQPAQRQAAAPHGNDAVSSGAVVQRPAKGTGGAAINDDNPGSADTGGSANTSGNPDTGAGTASGRLHPCALISKSQAQAIIGAPLASTEEAPLGPTCIYKPRGAGALVTVAVETIDLAALRRGMRRPVRTVVAGHTVYCAENGQTASYSPIPGGRVLDITAPCPVGARLAALALRKLDA
jgi:hypothetical protein